VQGTETGVSGAGFSISTGRACCDKFWSAHVRDRPRACLIEETILKPPGQSLMGGSMWDQLKRTDVELARQKLAELRGITVQRHAEELKQLDNDEAEIDTLARLAEAITKKYLNGGAQPNEQPTQGDAARDQRVGKLSRRNHYQRAWSLDKTYRRSSALRLDDLCTGRFSKAGVSGQYVTANG